MEVMEKREEEGGLPLKGELGLSSRKCGCRQGLLASYVPAVRMKSCKS